MYLANDANAKIHEGAASPAASTQEWISGNRPDFFLDARRELSRVASGVVASWAVFSGIGNRDGWAGA
jgi:hypothetical protein